MLSLEMPTKDSILCHLMLRACKDDALRAKMLEVPEDDMTQIRLKEVIDLYEIIERTNKGLSEKEKAKRAKGSPPEKITPGIWALPF